LLSADFDGNGITDVIAFNPAQATWTIDYGASSQQVQFGASNDIPVQTAYQY